jgi:hypothetical protein
MLTRFKLNSCLIVAHSIALTACAAEPTPDVNPAKRDTCVFFSALYDWQTLNDSHLVVWVPGKHDAYHLTLAMPLPGLSFAQSLGFIDGTRDGRLCSFGQDAITIGTDSMQQRSSIRSIEYLNPETLAQLEQQYSVRLAPQSKRKAPPKTPDPVTAQ